MTPKAKILASTSMLPVLADFLEDCIEDGLIRFKVKQEATKVIERWTSCSWIQHRRNQYSNRTTSSWHSGSGWRKDLKQRNNESK